MDSSVAYQSTAPRYDKTYLCVVFNNLKSPWHCEFKKNIQHTLSTHAYLQLRTPVSSSRMSLNYISVLQTLSKLEVQVGSNKQVCAYHTISVRILFLVRKKWIPYMFWFGKMKFLTYPHHKYQNPWETSQAHLSNLLYGECSPVVYFCPKTCWADSLSLPSVLQVHTYYFSSLEFNQFALHTGQGSGLVIFTLKHCISEISVMICCCEAP